MRTVPWTWSLGSCEHEVERLPTGGVRRRFHVSQCAPTRVRAVEQALCRLAADWPTVFGDLVSAAPALVKTREAPPLRSWATVGVKAFYRYTCAALGPHRQLWLDQRPTPKTAWNVWAIVDDQAPLLPIELEAHGPSVTRRGHEVRWWTGTIATSDPVLAFRSLMPRLVAEERAWEAIADEEFTPTNAGTRALLQGLAAAAVPPRRRSRILRALGIDEHDTVFERRVEHGWPSRHVRSVFAARQGHVIRLVAVCTRAQSDLPGRSPIGWSLHDNRAGVRQWVDAQHWKKPQWSVWDPSARHLPRQQVMWLCVDPPALDVALPEARVLPPAGEHREFHEPRRVVVASGASVELAHRAAVLAAAHDERTQIGADMEMEPARLEGIRVPWRHFRAAYDYAAANPVYWSIRYQPRGKRWSDDWYPGPRKPGVVFRWSGAWNEPWRWGYELWGCHIWSIEWLVDPSLPRRIDVIIDVQTD
jgi:hypothetical protein